MTQLHYPPTRSAALEQLLQFAPNAGHAYSAGRNTDPGPGKAGAVSRLSLYMRRRLITEHEVISTVLAHNSPQAADKFVQEILWRTYWKGWLEMRPAIWARFVEERARLRDTYANHSAIAEAEAGQTGIEGFDDWAREIVQTGYLHNHARMWFASIWIFTLGLPWVLGADFFLRHLIDADAASNNLSWRWVAGLHTAGKTYLATAENISRYTNGRFNPTGLASKAVSLVEPAFEAAKPLPKAAHHDPGQPCLLLLTDEDMHPESIFSAQALFNAAVVAIDASLLWGDGARAFANKAAADTQLRTAEYFNCPATMVNRLDAECLMAAATAAGVRHIITPYAPVGPVADRLAAITPELTRAGISLTQRRREWDEQFWPHAAKGFFQFKEKIPAILKQHGLM